MGSEGGLRDRGVGEGETGVADETGTGETHRLPLRAESSVADLTFATHIQL